MFTFFQKRKFIIDALFLWIPKAAGSSIYEVLEKYGCPKIKDIKTAEKFENRGLVTFSHMDVKKLLQEGYINQHYFDSAFKFCFVRNPWDRLVSYYFYKDFQQIMPFSDFCETVSRIPIYPIGTYNSKGLSPIRPQTDWVISSNGKPIVNYIGRYERIEKDFASICSRLGINDVLPKVNTSIHKRYRTYYTPRTRDLIGNMFKSDIEEFKYEF